MNHIKTMPTGYCIYCIHVCRYSGIVNGYNCHCTAGDPALNPGYIDAAIVRINIRQHHLKVVV